MIDASRDREPRTHHPRTSNALATVNSDVVAALERIDQLGDQFGNGVAEWRDAAIRNWTRSEDHRVCQRRRGFAFQSQQRNLRRLQ